MEDVLARLRTFNDQKLEELLKQYNVVRAARKLERERNAAKAKLEEAVVKAAEPVEVSPAQASMDKWMKLLDRMSKQ